MKILGIQDGHSASAALVCDGKVIAAVQEERLTRHKNQGGYPKNAIDDVLQISKCTLTQLDAIAFCGYGATSQQNLRDEIMANYQRRFIRKKRPARDFSKKLRAIRDSIYSKGREKRKRNRRLRKQNQRMQPLLQQAYINWHFPAVCL